jgi:large subunit ribosomal protein L11
MKVQTLSLETEKKRGVHEVDFIRSIRLLVPSQAATISPPLGPTLGQFGINIKDFCDKFNERSKAFENDIVLNVFINLLKNKNFDFELKLPGVGFMINEEEINVESEFINKYLTLKSAYKIAITKKKDTEIPERSLFNCILGTARSMDIKLINDIKKQIK